jgi:Na+/proline symporter
MSLGVLLYFYAQAKNIPVPERTDELYSMLALNHFGLNEGTAGVVVAITFLIGITAATYASSDSALTALTTSFCIDFMNVANKSEKERVRIKNWVHIGFSLLFYVVIIIFNQLNSKEVITAIFDIAGYTYGPLLGLFAFGLYTKRSVKDNLTPIVCALGPIITYVLNQNSEAWFDGYKIGFERLILNGAIVFLGLLIISKSPQLKSVTD